MPKLEGTVILTLIITVKWLDRMNSHFAILKENCQNQGTLLIEA